MIDAGVVVELVASDLDPESIGGDELAAPHLIDSEVTHALRGLAIGGHLTREQAATALSGFGQLAITRFPATTLRARMWELRDNLTAYDATYVALAEALDAEFLTTDSRVARAPGTYCPIRLL